MFEEDKIREVKAYEAFIRRAAEIDLPFMLKGSYVTRQYFQQPGDRIPGDLDWVYLERMDDPAVAGARFSAWATLVTELDAEDSVHFWSFRENDFWRSIDYAMADDFPTVNTDLGCYVDGKTLGLSLDVSFNLVFAQPPVPLIYRPLEGAPFVVPRTVPISLQVSWKIHQTMVRPRFKDLFDLIHLMRHPAFDREQRTNALQALVNECAADNMHPDRLTCFLTGDLRRLFTDQPINQAWEEWRYRNHYNTAARITDAEKLPATLPEFLAQFQSAMESAGIGAQLLGAMPTPTITGPYATYGPASKPPSPAPEPALFEEPEESLREPKALDLEPEDSLPEPHAPQSESRRWSFRAFLRKLLS